MRYGPTWPAERSAGAARLDKLKRMTDRLNSGEALQVNDSLSSANGQFSLTVQPVRASNTYGNDGAYLVLQDDRNLVIYAADGTPLWATNTTG